MKERFIRHGLDNFADHNVIELLLFFAIPRHDVGPLSHELINRFGGLAGVFEATFEELKSVEGLGESGAHLLKVIPEVSRRYMLAQTPRRERLGSSTALGRYMIPYFMYERDEVIYALFLDARQRVIIQEELGRGVVDAVTMNTRQITELALQHKASGVVLAHNHPSGVALPSAEDEALTLRVRGALSLVGVTLIDHIVVAGCDYCSMAESGLLTFS